MSGFGLGEIIGTCTGEYKVTPFSHFIKSIKTQIVQSDCEYIQTARNTPSKTLYEPDSYTRSGHFLLDIDRLESDFLKNQFLSKVQITNYYKKTYKQYKETIQKMRYLPESGSLLKYGFEEAFHDCSIEFVEKGIDTDGILLELPSPKMPPLGSIILSNFMFLNPLDWIFYKTEDNKKGQLICHFPERSTSAFQINLFRD